MKLAEILEELKQGRITVDKAEEMIADLFKNNPHFVPSSQESQQMKDYEFSFFRKWKGDDNNGNNNDDDHGPVIKHFQD